MKLSGTIITDSAGIHRIPREQRCSMRWLYLGKDVQQRAQVAARLDGAECMTVHGRLRAIADEVRRPYLDFLASCSRVQRDAVTWWSTTKSWRVWAVADLCLHVCYLRLVRQIVDESRGRSDATLIVIENPWVLRQLWEWLRDDPSVRFEARGRLWTQRLRLWCRGVLARTRWLLRTAQGYIAQRCASRGTSTQTPDTPAVAIYSYPQARCFPADGEWHDPYLPGIDRLCEALGYQVIRFVPPEARGAEVAIAQRSAFVQPLILQATLGSVLRALCTAWHPQWPEQLAIDGMPVNRLVQREYWHERGQSSLSVYRLFYDCFQRMISTGRWAAVVYPFENQPWEKLAAIAAQQCGVRAVGIQHSTMSPLYLSYFLGQGESAVMPLPDVIGVAGTYSQQLLVDGGVPRDRIVLCGSIRYPHMHPPAQLPDAPRTRVLVVLPDDVVAARHLLAAIGAVFPNGEERHGIQFQVKLHPATVELMMVDVPFEAIEAPVNFREALASCGTVLYTGSSVGIEAAFQGRRVLRYQPELVLDMDPAEAYRDMIPQCTDATLRQAVLAAAASPDRPWMAPRPDDVARVFHPVQPDVLRQMFRPEERVVPVAGHTAPLAAGATC